MSQIFHRHYAHCLAIQVLPVLDSNFVLDDQSEIIT